jgi:hypothetical protein
MDDEKVCTNYHGYKQFVDEKGRYKCICCKLPYTNEGDGLLCKMCADKEVGDD